MVWEVPEDRVAREALAALVGPEPLERLGVVVQARVQAVRKAPLVNKARRDLTAIIKSSVASLLSIPKRL